MDPEAGADLVGVVLAAGRSRRMGRSKSRISFRGASFLDNAVAILARGGCDRVLAVLRPGEDAAGEVHGAEVVLAANEDAPQIASLQAALRVLAIGTAHAPAAVIVLPVDLPAVQPSTVRRLVDAYRAGGCAIVRPMHAGAAGHPTLFAEPALGALLAPDLADGARSVIHALRASVHDVEVDDAGILIDVDTPDDFARLNARFPPGTGT